MNTNYKQMLAITAAAFLLSACGQKNESTSQTTSSSSPAEATPRYKTTEKFGTVSNITLTPVFQVPYKYSSYTRQEVSEATKEEYQKLQPPAFESYINTWVKQAASTENPDWQLISGVLHPESSEETNDFKKQEVSEKAKAEVKPDKKALDVVYGWQGQVMTINGPDIQTGEYYLTINPSRSYQVVSYENTNNQRFNLYYSPDFKAIGLTGDNSGDTQLTVKVPIEKAKEIESLREGNKPMIRVYGHVTGVSTDRKPIIRKHDAQAGLNLEVEAIELGVRKDGEFKSFFFLDSDQLKKAKA